MDGVATATITSDAIKEAAAAALTAAGLNADDYKTAVEADTTKAEDSTIDADVAIVGAGGAGMTAAITAAGEGKSVVILESQSMVGGNSVRATGGMNAGKTVYQDENEFGESAGVEKTLKRSTPTTRPSPLWQRPSPSSGLPIRPTPPATSTLSS